MKNIRKNLLKNCDHLKKRNFAKPKSDYYYATEEDVENAIIKLENIEKCIEHLYKWSNYYYMKTVAITQEMNRRGMWQLSS